MAIESLRDVYRHQLGESYDAEQQILALLDAVELEASAAELRDHVRGMRQQTLRDIATLERCFELAGTAAPRVQSGIVRGIVADRLGFLEEQPPPDALDAYNAQTIARLAALKGESFRQLGRMAQQLGSDDARRLLARNAAELDALRCWLDEPSDAAAAAPRRDRSPVPG